PYRMMQLHMSEPPPSPRNLRTDLPPAIDRVIDTALAKDPAKRFSTAGELAAAFKASLSGNMPAVPVPEAPSSRDSKTLQEIVIPRKTGSVTARRSLNRLDRRVLLGIGALAAVVVLIGILAVVLNRGPVPTPLAAASSVPAATAGATSIPPTAT